MAERTYTVAVTFRDRASGEQWTENLRVGAPADKPWQALEAALELGRARYPRGTSITSTRAVNPALGLGLLAGPIVSPVSDEVKALRRKHFGAPGTFTPKTRAARRTVRAVKTTAQRVEAPLQANPPRRKRDKRGFDAYTPDLFGGAGRERGEGRTRSEQLEFARQEMRDTGSNSLFDLLGDDDRRRSNPGERLSGEALAIGALAAAVVLAGVPHVRRLAASTTSTTPWGMLRSAWPRGSSTG